MFETFYESFFQWYSSRNQHNNHHPEQNLKLEQVEAVVSTISYFLLDSQAGQAGGSNLTLNDLKSIKATFLYVGLKMMLQTNTATL